MDKFRVAVQEWYDDHMKRVTGWYKRRTRWITLVVAAVLATAFNINTVAMAQAPYTDQALRESVVTAAFNAANCIADNADVTPAECLEDVRGQINRLRGVGLPIG